MNVNCDYCGSYIDSTEEECPHCGATNTHFMRTAVTTPKTIEELKAYCTQNKLPLEKMHVHIGEDYKAPKAFGIYKNEKNGHFVVYKNKADGSRSIRYEGTDELYAVNELYTKIKDLVMDAREATAGKPRANSQSRSSSRKKNNPGCSQVVIVVAIVIFLLVGTILAITDSMKDGYYNYNGDTYYRHGSNWYMYDDATDDWSRTSNMSDYMDDAEFLHDDYEDIDSNDSFAEFPEDDFKGDWESDSDWGGSNDDSWDSSYDSYDFDSGSDWESDW